jgi:hypothetical protein
MLYPASKTNIIMNILQSDRKCCSLPCNFPEMYIDMTIYQFIVVVMDYLRLCPVLSSFQTSIAGRGGCIREY